MTLKSIQDILPHVEMPSRYLGTEINSIKKNWHDVDLHVALAFPELYEIGSSHFGIQILYHLLNDQPNISAERVFAPALDMEEQLRSNEIELFSLESRRSVKDFDLLGFSLLYELTYTNVLNMLELCRIPYLSKDRDLNYPLVIAGGPCTANPEPMADIFDAMVIGDGEQVLLSMCDAWLKWRQAKVPCKEDLLSKWADIQGVYIPSFFKNGFSGEKKDSSEASENKSKHIVKRAILSDLNKAYFPIDPIVPYGKPVHDRLRLEVARGCSRGCRFCQAGMIYRPVRERKPENLVKMANNALKSTGYEDLSLLSLSTGDYGCINELMTTLMRTCEKEHISVSLPSLRAGTLTFDLMEQIKKVRKTGFTIAPEAGSQRLRDVINKNITEQDIIQTVKNAFEMGWHVIKLYFMVGLPTETQQDIDAIADLVIKLRKLKGPKGKRKQINVSVSTFIPKGHTPFQWAPQISPLDTERIITYLKDRINGKGVQLKWQHPNVSLIEGMMARGDRSMLKLIMAAHQLGCKFDGWNDYFSFDKWRQAFDETDIKPEKFINQRLDPSNPMPWDHLNIGLSKKFLLKEWELATGCHITKDCRWHSCTGCGICDFENIAPIVYDNGVTFDSDIANEAADSSTGGFYHKYKVGYSKLDNARLLGHLEMVKVFHRAIKRAGIVTEFSKGFHPMPKISFDNPLPLGMESECEHFFISIPVEVSPLKLLKKLNQTLPEGLRLKHVQLKKTSKKQSEVKTVTYQITIKDGFFDQNRLHSFMSREKWILNRTNRKGKTKEIDLKEIICWAKIEASNKMIICLNEKPGMIVRPIEILTEVFKFQTDDARSARILKIDVYDE